MDAQADQHIAWPQSKRGFPFRDGIVHIVRKLLLDNFNTYMYVYFHILLVQ